MIYNIQQTLLIMYVSTSFISINQNKSSNISIVVNRYTVILASIKHNIFLEVIIKHTWLLQKQLIVRMQTHRVTHTCILTRTIVKDIFMRNGKMKHDYLETCIMDISSSLMQVCKTNITLQLFINVTRYFLKAMHKYMYICSNINQV